MADPHPPTPYRVDMDPRARCGLCGSWSTYLLFHSDGPHAGPGFVICSVCGRISHLDHGPVPQVEE